MGPSEGQVSTARPMRAATGPPWRASGDQGPREKSVGTQRSPSGWKRASSGSATGIGRGSPGRGGLVGGVDGHRTGPAGVGQATS